MAFIACVLFVVSASGFCDAAISLSPLATVYLPASYSNGVENFVLESLAAEQSAYDPKGKVIYTIGEPGVLHVIDVSNTAQPTIVFNTTLASGTPTDIEVCGSSVALAVKNAAMVEPGKVYIYSIYNTTSGTFDQQKEFPVGSSPDMLVFSSDCLTLIVANEGTAGKNSTGGFEDPQGSVSVIKMKEPLASSTIKTLDFKSFNARADEYVAKGVRWVFRNVTSIATDFSQDLEPEFITINSAGTKAYVALQENNAIAVIDLTGEGSVDDIFPLGFKNWSLYDGFDASDRDGIINIHPWDVLGMYQPDAIKYFEHGGVGYIATANEGDAKEYDANKDGYGWEEEIKGGSMSAADSVSVDMKASLMNNSMLGRLRFSKVDGKADDGKYHTFYAYGARSFSIFKASDMSLVWDSGSDIEKTHKINLPSIFNNALDDKDNTPKQDWDRRSDNKGPEPESLAIAQIGSTTVFFAGNERISSISIYSMTAPSTTPTFESLYRAGGLDKTWEQLYAERNIGDNDPEDLRYISPSLSPDGKHLLIVSGSRSGTVSLYEIQGMPSAEATTDEASITTTMGSNAAKFTTSIVCVGSITSVWMMALGRLH